MPPTDIVSLRLQHCRAESALKGGQYHLAVLHYRHCLEGAERREDVRATQFFSLKLAECYGAMNLRDKALQFKMLALQE